MANLIMSRNSKLMKSTIFWAMAMLLICFINTGIVIVSWPNYDDADRFMNGALPVIQFALFIWNLVVTVQSKKCYLTIYNDHIEGQALSTTSNVAKSFRLNHGEYTVDANKSNLYLNTGAAKFYIHFNAQEARELTGILNQLKIQPTAPQPQIYSQVTPVEKPNETVRYCMKCGTQCRFPSGMGRVIVTCPSCGYKFETES